MGYDLLMAFSRVGVAKCLPSYDMERVLMRGDMYASPT